MNFFGNINSALSSYLSNWFCTACDYVTGQYDLVLHSEEETESVTYSEADIEAMKKAGLTEEDILAVTCGVAYTESAEICTDRTLTSETVVIPENGDNDTEWTNNFRLLMKWMVIMGKQINFYMSENVQNQFMDFLITNVFLFLDNDGEIIELENLYSYNDYYLYKSEFGCLLTKETNSSIDVLNSPIIEFCKTRVKENRIMRGRLWLSDHYCKNDNGQDLQSKSYISEYQNLVKWIKKNVPYQSIKKGDFFVKEYVNDELIDMEKNGYIFTA